MEKIIKKLEDVLSDYNNDKMSDIQSIATLCKEKLVATLNDKQKLIFDTIFALDSIRDDMLIGDNDEALKSLCQLVDYIKDKYPLRGNEHEQHKYKGDVLCDFCLVACDCRNSNDKSNCYMFK